MVIDKTTLMADVERILQNGVKNVFFHWSCEIIAGDHRVIPVRVVSCPLKRDYEIDIADKLELTVLVKEFEYDYIVDADNDRLQVVLYKNPQLASANNTNIYQAPSVQRFKAILNDSSVKMSKIKTGQKLSTPNYSSQSEQLKEITLNAYDLVAESIRLNEVGLNGRNVNPLLFVRTIIGKESKKVGGGDIGVRGVDIVPPSNEEIRDHILIKDGVPLQDLPHYVQKNCGGIYNAGIGFYLQSGLWYIYPLYDISRYTKTERNLTVFNISGNRFPGAESTYEVYGKSLRIANTGTFRYIDKRDEDYLEYGNGSRFTDAVDITEDFGVYRNGQYFIKRKDNNTEAVLENRRTGVNYAPVSPQRFTNNPYVEYSALAKRECVYAIFEWQNAVDDIIYPGMPSKIYFLGEGDAIQETTGTVLGVEYFYEVVGNRMTDPRYVCNAVVKMALRRIQ